jgi:vacuolar-type H+-ATPase subunit D/Vma8
MKYTSKRIETARESIVDTEQRIQRQRRRIEKLLVERHPADEAQAHLVILEDSLVAMKRLLEALERDFESIKTARKSDDEQLP